MSSTSPADIRAALAVAAQLVARDGPAFLPVFLRLEAAAREAETQDSALARAAQLAAMAPTNTHRANRATMW